MCHKDLDENANRIKSEKLVESNSKSYFTNHLTMFMNNLNVQPPGY